MSAFSQTTATNVLAGVLLQAAYVVSTAPIKVKLFPSSTPPSESAAGTEITPGGGYTAGGVAVTWNAPTVVTGTYSGRIGNASLVISNMPTAASISHIDIVDSTATPRRLLWGALTTARSTTSGDTLSFPSDSIVAQT
jgi:hypothetical protein